MRKGSRTVSRWFFGSEERVPRRVRSAFFAATLVILGATYASTGSEALQFLALVLLVFGVLPALGRRFGRRDEATAGAEDGLPPLRVIALSVAFFIAWTAAILLAAPDLGLGPWFWYLVLLWPCLEVHVGLGERDLRRNGAGDWKPFRPIRHSAWAGLAVTPALVVISLVQDVPAGEAVATGIACGFIVFAISATFVWLIRRANPPRESIRRDAPAP